MIIPSKIVTHLSKDTLYECPACVQLWNSIVASNVVRIRTYTHARYTREAI